MARYLIVDVAESRCAFPLEFVIETMRPLAIQPLKQPVAPAIRGLSLIRGLPAPVIDLAILLSSPKVEPTRWVTLRAGQRVFAVAVTAVIGIFQLAESDLISIPIMSSGAGYSPLVTIADGEIVRVLQTAQLVSEPAWQKIDEQAGADARR